MSCNHAEPPLAPTEKNDLKPLEDLLVCPICKGNLRFSADVISCISCGRLDRSIFIPVFSFIGCPAFFYFSLPG